MRGFERPYTFDFLTLGEAAQERDLERGLVEHVQKLLLEMGAGFAFVGRQVHVEVGDEDFYLDLLFYHLRLRCFVVVDLKMKMLQTEVLNCGARAGLARSKFLLSLAGRSGWR